MKKKTASKNIIMFFVLLVVSSLLIYTVFFHIVPLSQSVIKYQNELESLNNKLTNIQSNLKKNIYLLDRIQSGKNYEFYNPTYTKAKSIVENETYISVNQSINKFKSEGINCALAQIVMGKYLDMIELVGFYTIDEGMTYFELNNKHQVIPTIGDKYIDCVVGKPYKISLFNDTIVDILTIW